MAIEFRCTQCEKLLRTQDGTAGKKAKCPQCGTVLTIPDAATSAPIEPAFATTAPPPPPPRQPASVKPYQSPTATEPKTLWGARGFQPTRIDLGDVLSRSWTIYKANLGLCVSAGVLVLIVSWGLGFGVGLATIKMPATARLILQVATNLLSVWLTLGQMRFSLKVARGEDASLADLFSAGPFLIAGVVVILISAVAFGVGLIFLIVPGVVIWMMLSQALFLVLDQHADIAGSLRLSMKVTRGNKLTLLALYLVLMGLGSVFVLMTCGLGMFFFQPFWILALTVAYLALTGQSTADQRAATTI
jgi:phage FluMu protein Com